MRDFELFTPTFINGFNHRYHADVAEGWLSIKSMFHGTAVYTLENGRVPVDDSCYLILNDRQPYQLTIDNPTPIESFCIFFPASWASDVIRTFADSTDGLLDDPWGETAVSFHDVAHRHDQTVTPHLLAIRQARKSGNIDEMWQTEQLYKLLAGVVTVQKQIHLEIAKLPAIRKTTRIELYRRLNLGRDFIHSNFNKPISLQDIARNAYLSPYHFARNFKQLFGQTPHTYLTMQRIERAKTLLRTSSLPITEICFAVGFQSLGSFSTLFQRHCGMSPSIFRKLKTQKGGII